MAGAPKGNRNAYKGRIWNDTLRRAITQDDGERLRASVEQLLKQASTGEPWAIKTLAERLDGRPRIAEQVHHHDQDISEIKVVFIRPNNHNSND